jgi:hypothetical protein
MLAQLSACNLLHEVEERLARWPLMIHDRTGEPDINLPRSFSGKCWARVALQ